MRHRTDTALPDAHLVLLKTAESWTLMLCQPRNLLHRATTATDGKPGRARRLLIDENLWATRYWVLGSRNGWISDNVLIALRWIQRLSSGPCAMALDLSPEALNQAPWSEPMYSLMCERKVAVRMLLGRAGHWTGTAAAAA